MKKKNRITTDYPQKVIFFLFHLMVLIVPFFFTWVNEELFEFNKMILVYGFSTLIVSSWIIRMIINRKFLFKRTYLDIPIGLFLLSQIISTLFSMHPRTSFFGYYTRFHGGLLSTFSYLGLYYAFVNNFTKKQLKLFLLTVFIAALGVSLYAIPEHFGHSPSCSMITRSFDVECWQQKVQDRIFGTFGQPNWLAAYAIMLIPVGISLFINNSFTQIKEKSSRHLNILFAIAVAALLAVVIFTKSRSGFLGFGISSIVYITGLTTLYLRDFRNKKVNLPLKQISFLIISLLLIVGWFGSPFTPDIQKLINNSSQTEITTQQAENQPVVNRLDLGGTDSGEIREIVWDGAFSVWKRYPIFGSGVETFAYSYYKDRPMAHNLVSEWDFLYNKAHNELLNFLATTGIFGLLSYLSLFTLFGFKSLQFFLKEDKENKQSKQKILTLGIVSGILALSVSNFFGFSTVMVSTLMFIFFAAFEIIQTKETENPNIAEVKLEFWDYTWISSIALVALFILINIFNIWQADYIFTRGKRLVEAGYLSQGAPYLQKAIDLRPGEAMFYDKFATTLGQAALIFAEQEKASETQSAAQSAIIMSNTTLELNPVHLNFYKTRARLLIELQLLAEAKKTIKDALILSPTDAKLVFNLASIEEALGNKEEAFRLFKQSVEMKDNYGTALNHLAELSMENNNLQEALSQYRKILLYFPGDKTIEDKVASLEAQLAN